jgi:4-amino-4-deoxy-L-arabinose transferase-like glycosyltransferase
MPSTALPLASRIRIYCTLALQTFPFIGLAGLATESLQLNTLIIMGLFLLVIAGLVLELMAKPLGRPLALAGLGVQALGVLTFFIWALIESELGFDNIGFEETLVILAFHLPVWLWLWNFFGGRRPRQG